MTPLTVVLVVAAGAAGAVLRYLVARAGAKASWPWPVLLVNVAGSLVAGFAFHTDLALIAVTGFAGGLTTFSTFSVETVQLGARKRWGTALASVALNLGVGLAAAAIGWMLGLAFAGA
jgi:CrcB protein